MALIFNSFEAKAFFILSMSLLFLISKNVMLRKVQGTNIVNDFETYKITGWKNHTLLLIIRLKRHC